MHNSKNNRFHIIAQSLSLLILCCSFGVSPMVQADAVKDLYETRVWVASQAKKERSEALQQAFMEILVRVSGRVDIAQSTDYPNIQTAIEMATRYAQQYRYLKYTPKGKSRAPKGKKLILWVRFDEAAVSSLLRKNNIPVWGKTRPSTLVWLVIDNRGQRELIGNNSQHKARTILIRQARHRGVPLRLPLLDLKDRSALRTSDVWGNFESTIMKASTRYQTEAVLVGRVFQSYGGHWNARWSLYADSRRTDYSLSGTSIEEVLRPGIDSTAEALASRYASVGLSDTSAVIVQVKDIKNFSDYNRVVNYLTKLSNVSSVHPFQLAANTTIFRLTTPAGRLGVARAIALGHTLVTEPVSTVPIPKLPGEETQQEANDPKPIVPDLIYRLIP